MLCPSFEILPPVRAQGKPGADCTRGLVCQKCALWRTRAYRFSRNIPAFPAQWLYGLLRALPGDEFLFVTVVSRIKTCLSPVGFDAPPRTWHQQRMPGPHDFAVRSSRLRQEASPGLVPVRRSFSEGGSSAKPSTSRVRPAKVLTEALKHRSSCTPSIAHEVHLALRSQARAMLPRPPHPIPTFSDDGRRPSSGMRRHSL